MEQNFFSGKVDRRRFLVTTGKIALLAAVSTHLESCRQTFDVKILEEGLNFLNDQGASLQFYFININDKGKVDPVKPAFIIIQFPPQNLHENPLQGYMLPGPSYIVLSVKKEKFRMSEKELFDWNNRQFYDVVLGNDLPVPPLVDLDTISDRKLGDWNNKYDLNRYQQLTNHQYYSIFELPAGFFVVPYIRDNRAVKPGVPLVDAHRSVQIIQNNYKVAKREYRRFSDTVKLKKREILERWRVEINTQLKTGGSFNDIKLAFRLLFYTLNKKDGAVDNFLPSEDDKKQLQYLQQLIHKEEQFDIALESSFFLSTQGATTKYHYKNYDVPAGVKVSLAEYEHHFQYGRDNYMKISVIGNIAPTGHTALYTRIQKRVEVNGINKIIAEYKLQILKPTRLFAEAFPGPNAAYHFSPNIAQINTGSPVTQFKFPFISATALELKPMDVKAPTDATGSPITLFWSFNEQGLPVYFPFEYTDHCGKTHIFRHQVYFLEKKEIDANSPDLTSFKDFNSIDCAGEVICLSPDSIVSDNRVNHSPVKTLIYGFAIRNSWSVDGNNLLPILDTASAQLDIFNQGNSVNNFADIQYHPSYFSQPSRFAFTSINTSFLFTIPHVEQVDTAFSSNKELMGALIMPDVNKKNINTSAHSLISVPEVFAGNPVIKTADLFKNSKAGKILGGIDFEYILHEMLGIEESPQLVMEKVLNGLEDLTGFPDYVKKAIQEIESDPFLKNLRQAVESLRADVVTLNKQKDELLTQLNDIKDQFTKQFPDLGKIRKAAITFSQLLFNQLLFEGNPTAADLYTKITREIQFGNARPLPEVFTTLVAIKNEASAPVPISYDFDAATYSNVFQSSLADYYLKVYDDKAMRMTNGGTKCLIDFLAMDITDWDMVNRVETEVKSIIGAGASVYKQIANEEKYRTEGLFKQAKQLWGEYYIEEVIRLKKQYLNDLQQVNGFAAFLEQNGNLQKNIKEINAAINGIAYLSQVEAVYRTSLQDTLNKRISFFISNYAPIVRLVSAAEEEWAMAQKKFTSLLDQSKKQLGQLEKETRDRFIAAVKKFAGADLAVDLLEAYLQYKKISDLLATPQKQTFVYNWTTDKFRSFSLGIVTFKPSSSPKTQLKAAANCTVHYTVGKLPQAVEKTEFYSYNELTNFDVSFLSAVVVSFEKISFEAGSGRGTHFDTKINGVFFEGAFSFIQKLEELLKGLVDGFEIILAPKKVSIGYTLPIPSIETPGFTFANFSIGVLLNIYFKPQPFDLTIQLAKRDSKAVITANALGGAFYCAVTLQPEAGITDIAMALEMGAFLKVGIGPISGEVKLMVGLFYQKDASGVILEGYFIAEGTLRFWVISISARLYMGVRSQNSQVTGFCIVTYSVKIGFLKKSFSGTFRKQIAGAATRENSPNDNLSMNRLTDNDRINFQKAQTQATVNYDFLFEDDYKVMDPTEWKTFYNKFFTHAG